MIVGHVDSRQGPAVFFRLGRLRRGNRIVVGLTRMGLPLDAPILDPNNPFAWSARVAGNALRP